jgi:SAM-dependent methyltransferase
MTASDRWLIGLERRHFSDLTFQEVSRALRALSATYVERRHRLREGAALAGAGKRAAFAVFYGPLHYLLVSEIVKGLGLKAEGSEQSALSPQPLALVDLGCGTGAAGAAWAETCDPHPRVIGVDANPWALTEAAQTYRDFGLTARTVRGDATTFAWPRGRAMILVAFVVNELDDSKRDALLRRLLERAAAGDRVLVVEPLARSVTRWWPQWEQAVVGAGGRSDEWRFQVELPALVRKLDRAAGLDHRELTGRSLYI